MPFDALPYSYDDISAMRDEMSDMGMTEAEYNAERFCGEGSDPHAIYDEE